MIFPLPANILILKKQIIYPNLFYKATLIENKKGKRRTKLKIVTANDVKFLRPYQNI